MYKAKPAGNDGVIVAVITYCAEANANELPPYAAIGYKGTPAVCGTTSVSLVPNNRLVVIPG